MLTHISKYPTKVNYFQICYVEKLRRPPTVPLTPLWAPNPTLGISGFGDNAFYIRAYINYVITWYRVILQP